MRIKNVIPNATNFTEMHWNIYHPLNLSLSRKKACVRVSDEIVLYLNFHGWRPCFGWKRGWKRRESAQPLGDEPKMQLSMRGETGDRHDALQAGWLWEDFDSHPGREVIFPPFFSSCRMIKSQMSDTARHPKSAHCINISHRWQLCIKTTCS